MEAPKGKQDHYTWVLNTSSRKEFTGWEDKNNGIDGVWNITDGDNIWLGIYFPRGINQ